MSEGVLDLPGVRQCLLSFYSRNSTFVTLRFTNEIQLHLDDEDDQMKDGEMKDGEMKDGETNDGETEDEKKTLKMNILVLLAMTEKYDETIYRQMQSGSNIELVMPFGWPKTFKDVVDWIIYGAEPTEFVDYQRCAELGRFYGIVLPDHPDDENPHQSIGLINIQKRIRLLYGSPYGIKITSGAETGNTVTILLPRKEGKY